MIHIVKFKETKKRSVTKSISYRILVIASDLVIMYLLTRKVAVTITITVLTNLASTLFYFAHERAWNNINWGRQRIR